MSVLVMKQSEPNLWIAEIALSIVMYWREKIILVDKMVYAGGPWFGEGQMKYCLKLVRVLFGNKADRWNLEILKWGEWKGPAVRPFATS